MVLTDADYNFWYLSKNRHVYTLQKSLDIVLQSNPLFFVGYTLSDVDLLRILRQASLRWESERVASNLFLLLSQAFRAGVVTRLLRNSMVGPSSSLVQLPVCRQSIRNATRDSLFRAQ